ncbi:Telomere-associated protein RIF1 [Geodia barretti]|uniref:Telomere-associated protein RIF1 n=1 Tax=Geodia barretti TaxID=519541 RepID=A0AA35QVW3_GEOBA|nr:Telomere-associated protein RIF1 [Geodia barretti]
MAASHVVSNHSEPFTELWAVLGKAGSSPTERASAYQALAGSLKGEVSPEFINALTNQYKKIITLVMYSVAHTPACGDDAGNIIGALCSVRYKKPVEKSMLTRALWCLSSQNFHSYQICHSVPQVVTLATEIILEHGFGSLAVESLNVFRRIHQQCPKEFGLVVSMWYRGVIVLMNCKAAKFQRKAHSFAIMFESSIASNNYLVGYLCKELKERVIAAMLGYMEERGKDPILIMNIWSHFVTVLGNALHKHSSFLNEMLRVVEIGFKHKVFLVQIAAYSAWRVLINNFSIEMDRLTQQRRLRLLLMPLLASAVKDKHEQVETARLLTWWHLIRKLGPNREILFNQVCVPFLLFCLGVDPKLDLSKLPSVLADLGSWTHPTPLSLPPPDRLPTNQNKENLPAPRCPTGQGKTGSLEHGFSGRAGRLLTMLSSSSPGKKSDRLYQNTPKLGLVMSACQAVLQFVDSDVTLHGSLLDTDGGSCVVYPKNAVPFEVVQFLTVFLDGALLYMVHYAKEVKDGSVESLVKSLFPVFLGTIKRESATDAKTASHLVALLTSMLKWEAVTTNVSTSTRMELLSQLITLPPPLTSVITTTHGPMYWSSVAHELINMASTEHNHPRFQSSWCKVVELSACHSGGPASLATFSELCTHLDRFVTTFDPDCPKKHTPSATFHRMWISVGQKFIGAVKETSQVNEGTALDPNFATARRILKFPFLHRVFCNSERPMMSVTFETWKEVYDTFCLHCSLVVKDPNHCAELVCKDIYDSYGQNVRGSSTTLDKSETVNFDWYQNTVGQALTHVLTKFNWTHLRSSVPGEGVGGRGGGKGGREGGVKTVQPLISVLSWQLATLWDTVQRSPMQIGHLSSPYTLMETVTLLYSDLPSQGSHPHHH